MPNYSDYPHTVEIAGAVMNLIRETRWNRVFAIPNGGMQLRRSRFQDGSATITAKQLEAEWKQWIQEERSDFCDAIAWLAGKDRKKILRFLVKNADFRLLHNNALVITRYLPKSESVPWLSDCIEQSDAGKAIAYIQALAWTQVPEAKRIIEDRLAKIWLHPNLYEDDSFMNWVAAEAVHSINQIIELGRSTTVYAEQAARLAAHPCLRVRELYGSILAPRFPS